MARKLNKSKKQLKKQTQKRTMKNKTQSNRKITRSFFPRKLRGGADFGPASWNTSMSNPYLHYSKNDFMNDPSYPEIGNLSARNIGGGKTSRPRQSKKKRRSRIKDEKIGGGPDNGTPLGMSTPISSTAGYSFGSSAGAGSANLFVNSGLPLSSAPYDNKNFIAGLV
jgi:hypothetical protein